eukprot:SAG31_NODE_1438_length_8338_cov_18.446413_8_plen_84_part_00
MVSTKIWHGFQVNLNLRRRRGPIGSIFYKYSPYGFAGWSVYYHELISGRSVKPPKAFRYLRASMSRVPPLRGKDVEQLSWCEY